jgi:hypothetical protein
LPGADSVGAALCGDISHDHADPDRVCAWRGRRRERHQRLLGDTEAIRRPHKIPKRVANKLIGRGVVSKLWR